MTAALQIDLQPFCENDPEASIYSLIAPWRVGKFIYATDGRRIARIPDDGRDLPMIDGKRPDTAGLFEKFKPGEFHALPDFVECKCEIGTAQENCETCFMGKVTCEYDHEHDCPDCDGKGKVTVTKECECVVKVNGYKFRRHLLEPYRSLHGIECAFASSDKGPALVLRAHGGFEGIVMGLSR